jgi:hypothetical protein
MRFGVSHSPIPMDPYDAVRPGMTPQRWREESTLTRPLAMLSVANYLKQLGRNQVELLPGVKDERMIIWLQVAANISNLRSKSKLNKRDLPNKDWLHSTSFRLQLFGGVIGVCTCLYQDQFREGLLKFWVDFLDSVTKWHEREERRNIYCRWLFVLFWVENKRECLKVTKAPGYKTVGFLQTSQSTTSKHKY